jgi:hypothetical protein
MDITSPMMPANRRLRDAKGRFMAKPKTPPLSAQTIGDLTALTIVEEAEPSNCLELTDTYTVHESWWQGRRTERHTT